MRGEACCGHSTCGGPSVIISVLLVEELKLVVMMGCSWAVKPLSPSEAHVVSTSSEPCPVPGARDSSLYWVLTSVLSKRLGEPHCAESQPLTEVPPWVVEGPTVQACTAHLFPPSHCLLTALERWDAFPGFCVPKVAVHLSSSRPPA